MESILEKDRKFIWHPFTSFYASQQPIPIVKGEGIFLIDEKHNHYLDAISSWWVTLHGHAHPYIAEKIYRQALEIEQVIFAGFTHKPAVELAERLLQILPGSLSKIFYSDDGSTSTEVAIKMSIQYWWNRTNTSKRNKIFALKNAYHGDTFGAMSVSDRSVFTLAFQEKLFDVIVLETPDADNIDQTRKLIEKHQDEAAAFIYEPIVQGAGGMKVYDLHLLDEILGRCQSAGIICIADEVMTGFGRTGKLFASEYMENKPDIICLSKGLTGGTMALGVTACNAKIVEAFNTPDKLKTFFHGHSFTANPIACSAALASLDLLLEPSCLHQIELISAINRKYAQQLSASASVKNVRGIGTILAFEIDKGKDEYLNTVSESVTASMLSKGVYLRPLGNTVYLMPPYCITEQQLDYIFSCLFELMG
jgi:adenosylmethionine-8-amino-7-oxononanoate aminotransferase